MHGAVDAVAKCKKLHKLHLHDIEKINIHTFKMAFEEGNRPKPKTVLDAQFSIHYNIAAYLIKNAIGIEDFSPEDKTGYSGDFATSFLFTPSGAIKRYDPHSGKIETLKPGQKPGK
jgi:hypothetical protein